MELEACIFKFKYSCNDRLPCSQNKGLETIHSIIAASKAYGDDLHLVLEARVSSDGELKISYQKNCVSKYTSVSNTKHARHAKKSTDEQNPCPKRLRYSGSPFDFFTQCLYCGDQCILNKDKKNLGDGNQHIFVGQQCPRIVRELNHTSRT